MNVAVLPALSVAVTVPFTDDPSVASVKGLDSTVDITPERLSAGEKRRDTLVLFQPAALGGGFGAAKPTVGGVLSILMPLIRAGVLTFPALSRQVPNADCPAPSPSNVIAPVHESMPDKLSVPLKLIVTFVLFQPLTLGTGEAVAGAGGGPVLMDTSRGFWGFLLARFFLAKKATVLGPSTEMLNDPQA